MSYENLIVEQQGGIAVLTFNRPKALNALNRKTLEELIDATGALDADDAVKAVIVTGSGKAFVAGADVREMKDMNEAQALGLAELGHRAMDSLQRMKKPVLAAVNGFALGGGAEVALSCDFIYAADVAKLGFPEVTLGIFPGFGGTQRASRLMGKARAKELIFTGAIITASEALAMGLVNKVFPADALLAETRKTAETIISRGWLAVQGAKDVIDRGCDTDLAGGCDLERRRFAKCFLTEDQKEGMTAFVEKRPPQFKNR
jgi:enoyl-CoA hydratase